MVRVLIVSALSMLGQGLEAWLRQQRGVDVVGHETDSGRVCERIEQLRPDVVIIDESTLVGGPATALMRFLASRPGTKIIGVDLQENSFHIFSSEERAIDLVGQFVEAIRGQQAADEGVGEDCESRT